MVYLTRCYMVSACSARDISFYCERFIGPPKDMGCPLALSDYALLKGGKKHFNLTERAARKGNSCAMVNLAIRYLENGKEEMAMHILKLAAQSGNRYAKYKYAVRRLIRRQEVDTALALLHEVSYPQDLDAALTQGMHVGLTHLDGIEPKYHKANFDAQLTLANYYSDNIPLAAKFRWMSGGYAHDQVKTHLRQARKAVLAAVGPARVLFHSHFSLAVCEAIIDALLQTPQILTSEQRKWFFDYVSQWHREPVSCEECLVAILVYPMCTYNKELLFC